MRKFIVILILCVFGLSSNAQLMRKKNPKMTNRKHMSMIDFKGYKSSGWMVAPGLTYQLTRFNNPEETLFSGTDSSFKAKFDPSGRLGGYLEFGRYHIMYNGGKILNYIDYSLAYKGLGGKEKYSTSFNTSGDGKYKYRFALANFNLNNVYQLSNNVFLQNSLGFNIDYRWGNKTNYDNRLPYLDGIDESSLGNIKAQIHYRIGFGFKMTKRWFVIPTLETPVLNLYTFDEARAQWNVFNSHYQPIIFSVRMAWLRPIGGLSCGTSKRRVKKQKTSNQEQEAQKRYNNR